MAERNDEDDHAPAKRDDDEAVDGQVIEPEPIPREQVQQIAEMIIEQYSGQFPHPEHMERYVALYPDAAKVIFTQFEKQGAHRRDVEKIYAAGSERRANIGQWLAGGLVVLAIGAGVFAIAIGQAITGGVIIAAVFAGSVILYIAQGGAKPAPPARDVKANRRQKGTAKTGEISTQQPPPDDKS